jgi:hypothetical protein
MLNIALGSSEVSITRSSCLARIKHPIDLNIPDILQPSQES